MKEMFEFRDSVQQAAGTKLANRESFFTFSFQQIVYENVSYRSIGSIHYLQSNIIECVPLTSEEVKKAIRRMFEASSVRFVRFEHESYETCFKRSLNPKPCGTAQRLLNCTIASVGK